MVSKEEFQGWILDYACYHRIFPIIHAISLRHAGCLDELPVPHLRLACATIHFIIKSEQLSQFDEAIKLVQQVNQAIPPLLVCQKTYMRLLTGLKIKALFQQLEEDTDRALVKLNTYFPRSTPKSTNLNKGQTLSTFNQNHKNFRCFFFSLVSNENQLRAYLKEDYNAEFGPKFMESIKKLCGRFLQQIESHLLPPMIEKVLACTECEKFSQISPATEMLLDFVHEKKLSSQSDPSQRPSQQTGHRASLVFTEQELFEMLTVSCPLYTQDWLARDHGLNLSSQDLFDSFDSQETLPHPFSQMHSPHVIISKSQESTSGPLVPPAEPQERRLQPRQPPQQGLSENWFQGCIQQTLQQLEALQDEPPEVRQALRLECTEQQSAVVQGEVRRSQLAPGENQLRTPTIREEEEPSKMETEAVQQCERIEDEMEHTGAQPKTVDQSQMIQDRVQPSHRGPETGHRSQMIHGEVRPSKRKFGIGHPSEMIEDEIRPSQRGLETRHQSEMKQVGVQPSQIELEALHLSQIAAQHEVPPQYFTRQVMVQENILPQSEILERTLSQLPKLPQDQQLPQQDQQLPQQDQQLPKQDQQLPQRDQQLPQQEPCPQTFLQITDFVQPSDPSSVVNVSFPLTQKTDPPNRTSRPNPHPREPSSSNGQQEKDTDNQRQPPPLPTDPDPLPQESLTQPKYIRPWLGYVPRRPSYKLLKSKVFISCNIDDKDCEDAEMGVTRKGSDPSAVTRKGPDPSAVTRKRPDPSAVTLEKNSPKHSSAAEENSSLSCPQSDKGSDILVSSGATTSSLRLSTDLSSISSGSCDIVSPSDSNSAEVFFMGTPDETIDSHYNFISRHLLQGVKACIIKLYRNQQLDVVDGEEVYSIYS